MKGNKYVLEMAEDVKVNPRDPKHSGLTFFINKNDTIYYLAGHMGIWDGSKFVFESSPWSVVTFLKFVWQFGVLDFLDMNIRVNDNLAKFMKIYDHQENNEAFVESKDLWKRVDLYNLTQNSTSDYFGNELSSENATILTQLIHGVNKVNYNQNNNELNALAGVVSLCPLVTGELVQIEEGNSEIFSRVIEKYASRVHKDVKISKIVSLEDEEGKHYFLEETNRNFQVASFY